MPINKAVSLIITTRFEELCLAGHFPEVEFKKGVVSGMNMVSYSGMPYTE
jgi:hypothetical protein